MFVLPHVRRAGMFGSNRNFRYESSSADTLARFRPFRPGCPVTENHAAVYYLSREQVFFELSGERVVAAPQPFEEHANASRNASGAMPIAPSVKLAPSDMVTWAESRRSFICVIVTFGAGGVLFSPPYNKNDQRNNH